MTGGIAGPSVWAVSDGRAGIERQSLSLARALCAASRWSAMPHMRSDDCRAGPVRLQPGGLQLLLPPDRWPAPLAALPPSQRNLFKPPWPDVWIASGRRSIPYSRLVKKWSGGTTFVVQTQYPKVGMEPFDLVIAPEHDEVRGANVLSILGPPTFFSEEEVEDARLRFGDLAAHPGLKLLVSIGGDSKTHRMTGARIGEIEAALGELSGQGVRLWITVSRRTPALGRAR
ncbi:MAG: ELM1/GtrOC1 family putative glycosyltransferase, partial [Alphaproteobacteria bacterium]|nr:ELM1/GtrOC1 family putative glycosyltransferase [Alphaproteobacteria bacterium]